MGKQFIKLSAEETASLRRTWSIVKEDQQATGELIFHVLLETHPEFEAPFDSLEFAEDDEVPEVEGRPLSKKVWYRRHAGIAVMSILGKLVNQFDDKDLGFTIQDELLDLGEKHWQLGITVQHVQAFKEAAIESLRRGLKSQLTEEADLAWRKLLEAVCSTIAEGVERKNVPAEYFDLEDKN